MKRATCLGTALTSDDLPDVCFLSGGGNNEGSRSDRDTRGPDDIPGPGINAALSSILMTYQARLVKESLLLRFLALAFEHCCELVASWAGERCA